VANHSGVQLVHPLPQHQVVGGTLQPPRCNRNAERRQRRRAHQLQVGTTDCPTEAERKVQTSVSSAPHPTCEVRLWQPKREVHQAGSFEAPLPRRQFEACAPCQAQEARASRHGASSPAFLKRLCPDAITSNARAASLISRDARLAFRSHDARTASQNLTTQLYEARMPPALSIARPISLIPLPRI